MPRTFMEQPPESPVLTDYDRRQMITYARLLDAVDDGADWREAVFILFGINPDRDGSKARRVYDSHLARARWMTQHGYRQLVQMAR